MLKKTITYQDYNGTIRTENFYFNLTKAEIMEMELTTIGGFVEKINNIIAAKDAPTLIRTFKELVLKAYGEKSPDGKRFIKSEEISTAFSQTEAYSIMFTEFATDANAAAAFVNGIIPSDLAEEVKKTGDMEAIGKETPASA